MKKTFTLIEVFIVVLILAVLAAVAVPKLLNLRPKMQERLDAIGSNWTVEEVMRDSEKLEGVNRQYDEIKKVEKQNQEKIKSSDFESDVIGW